MKVLKLHSEPVREEWLDAYGHLNEAYYLVPISNASWALQDHFGIGVDYFERTGGAIYTVESHLRYLREVRAPAVVEIESMIFDADAKRLRFAHVMKVDGEERATFECVGLHYDTRSNRTAPLPDDVQTALKAARVVELPGWAGRRVTLEKQWLAKQRLGSRGDVQSSEVKRSKTIRTRRLVFSSRCATSRTSPLSGPLPGSTRCTRGSASPTSAGLGSTRRSFRKA